jgi:hypothetical protein
MAIHIIRNPVPTPEEMAKFLGVSPERLAAVRRIMDEDDSPPVKGRSAKTAPRKAAAKKQTTRR